MKIAAEMKNTVSLQVREIHAFRFSLKKNVCIGV